jgi:hypothetical protein
MHKKRIMAGIRGIRNISFALSMLSEGAAKGMLTRIMKRIAAIMALILKKSLLFSIP